MMMIMSGLSLTVRTFQNLSTLNSKSQIKHAKLRSRFDHIFPVPKVANSQPIYEIHRRRVGIKPFKRIMEF